MTSTSSSPSSKPPRPRDAAAEDDTRLRILRAAGPVFATHGFERATIRGICRAAGVNVAAIGYHFGDKMGLYLELCRRIRARREQRYPLPDDSERPAGERLYRRIHILLSRMLIDSGEASWEAQLMMREMDHPTAALDEMVQQYFRPMFEQLTQILGELCPAETPGPVRQQLAFSVVGQCLYHRIGRPTVRALVPAAASQEYFSIDALARHITAVTLAAAEGGRAQRIAASLPATEPPSSHF